MVNKALLTEATRAMSQAPSGSNKTYAPRTSLLILKSGKPSHITTLANREHFLNLPIHIYSEREGDRDVIKNAICNSLYQNADPSATCHLCPMLNDKGQPLHPIKYIKAFPVYVHDLEGEVKTAKSGREYTLNPICIAMLRSGRKGSNFHAMDALQEQMEKKQKGDVFTPGRHIFQMKRSGEGLMTTYEPLSIIHPDFLGDEFDPNSEGVKKALEVFTNKTPDEIYQTTLLPFTNVRWDIWGLDRPTEDVVQSEAVTTDSGKKAKNALG